MDTEGQSRQKLFVFRSVAGGSGNERLGCHQEFPHVASHMKTPISLNLFLFTHGVLFMIWLSLVRQSSPPSDRLVCNSTGVLLEGIPLFSKICCGVLQMF